MLKDPDKALEICKSLLSLGVRMSDIQRFKKIASEMGVSLREAREIWNTFLIYGDFKEEE